MFAITIDHDQHLRLVATVDRLYRIIRQQAVRITTLEAYIRQDPTFDAERFRAIRRGQRDLMKRLLAEAQIGDDLIRIFDEFMG